MSTRERFRHGGGTTAPMQGRQRAVAARSRVGAALALGAAAALLVAASARAVVLCNHWGCTIVGGPVSPGRPHNDRGMKATVNPGRGALGTFFRARASGFKPREYVTVWEYQPGHRASFLPDVRRASRTGARSGGLHTFAGVDPPGRWYVCFKGLTTGRVACAAFRVTGRRGLRTTPTPGQGGTSGPSSGGGSGAPPPSGCRSWNVAGSWRWVSSSGEPGSGTAQLSQSGSAVTGTINDPATGLWSISGSLSGARLTLSFQAPDGQASPSSPFVGSVSATKITGSNYGDFTNGSAHCQG